MSEFRDELKRQFIGRLAESIAERLCYPDVELLSRPELGEVIATHLVKKGLVVDPALLESAQAEIDELAEDHPAIFP